MVRWLSWLAAVCLILGTGYSVLSSPDELPDPLPLRRLLLPPERVPEEMKRLGQGLLRQLPRDDFEDLVRHAARAGEAARKVPRLVVAHYRARLVENDLAGSAEWDVINPAGGPAVLPLPSLNLALRQPRFENRPALLGELDGKNLGLLLDGGEQALSLDWSAHGERRPEGLAFALEVPPAPVATLEVQVPADSVVAVASDGCLLSGPAPAETPDLRLWTVAFAGRAQVRLVVRKDDGHNPRPPLVLAALLTRLRLTPDAVDAEFTFDLKVLHHTVEELRCECDPGLRPYRVLVGKPSEDSLRPLDGWQFVEGPAPALVVRLPEPFQGGILQVHALAPLGGNGGPVPWTCPGLRLAQAVPRGETIELRLHPDVYLEQWQPGGFRLTQARAEADGGQVLTLTGGGLTGGGQLRPSARLLTAGVDVRAREVLWWQVEPAPAGEAAAAPAGPSSLTVLLSYDVVRGHLSQLPVALPPGWDVDRLQLDPPELLRNWGPRSEAGRTVLLVDLQRPVSPGPAAPRPGAAETRPAPGPRLTVWLRPSAGRGAAPDRGAAGALSYPFPDVVPLGVRLREGALAIDLDETLYEARVDTPARATTPGEDGPWGKQLPDYYFPYRGQPVRGTLTLQPRRPRVRARCSSAVGLTADRAAVETHLTLLPEVGTPDAVDLYLSAPPAGRWEWKTEEGTNAVRSFERLPAVEAAPLLGAVGVPPLQAAGLLAALDRRPAGLRGERWRLTLARPLREPVTLVGSGELRCGGDRVDVPLPAVPGAARMEGDVKLYLAGANLVQAESVGLREVQAPAGGRSGGPPPWRAFHYGQPPLALTLHGQGAAPDQASAPAVDRAHLTTYAGPDGHLLLHYRCQVEDWQQPTFPLRLPAGARVLRARVDGRWLTNLPTGDGGPDGVLLALPVPGGATRHHCEVVYALDRPGWTLWASLEAPAPGLPLDLKPGVLRRTWHLAPGVAPLRGGQDRLPGPVRAPDTPASWAEWAGAVLERWGPEEWLRRLALSHASPDDWQAEQRQRLVDAGTGAAEGGKARGLGEALERLVFDRLQDQEVLVLDAEALREAGLGPATPLPAEAAAEARRPFWEGAGLVHLPCRAAPLLTTRRQAEAWRYAAGPATVLSPSLAQAVAEAVLFGHDRSGRFATVMDWLAAAAAGADPDPDPLRLVPEPVGSGWTAWEPLAGTPGEEALLVVRQDALPWCGGALAGFLALTFWRARHRSPRRRLALLLLWLAVAGLGVCWLPASLQALAWWPLLAGLLVAAGWYVRAAFARRPPPAPSGSRVTPAGVRRAAGSRGSGVVGALLLLGLPAALALLPHGQAAAPEPVTVFLISGPADAPDKQTVLAPPDLLTQLEALARRGSPALRDPVLVAAEYRGEVRADAEDAARFEAGLTVHSFTDEPATLALPLAGAQLEEVLVDGARTPPLPGPAGYSLPVRGKGDHVVTLRFRVPVQASGLDRDLQFTAPRVAQSRLTLAVPDGSQYLHALVRQGATKLDAGGTHLEVDLGQVAAPLHFRWRWEAGPPQPPAVKVQELYLWDLGASSSGLTAVLQYAVERGAVTSLDLELPGSLEVRNAEATPLGGEDPAPRLRGYEDLGPVPPSQPGVVSKDAPRRLRLDFGAPVTAGVQVLLDLVPRRPLDAREVLPLPAPVGAEATAGYLAYRLDGLEGELKTFLRVKPIDLPEFARRWKAARGSAPPALSYACIFGRKPAAPELGLDLHVQRPRLEAVQELAWRVGPQQADLRATLRLTAPDGDLGLVEWDAPGNVTLARVTGPDVRHWSRSGPRLQVWLQRTVSTTELQLSGWWLPPGGAPGPRDQGAKANPETQFTLDLPRLGVPSAQGQTTFVRLIAVGSLALTRVRSTGLAALPDLRASDQERAYVARQPDYGGSFLVRPAAAGADVRVLTVAEVRDRQLAFTARVDCRPRRGELRTVEVRLRNWDGESVALDGAPEGAQVRERRPAPGDRGWTVDLPPGVTHPVRLILTGSLPLDEAAGGVPMPDVTVAEAARSERWLAVAGGELLAEDRRGLAEVEDVAAVLRAWPEEAKRLRAGQTAVWKVPAADDWDLRLQPRDPAAGPARVFLTEQVARVQDGRHWVHQATYWLYHEGSTDLRVTLPGGAAVLGASVDGTEVIPLPADPGGTSLWLPLPGGTGAREVCLRWAFPEGEALDRPNLDRPRLGDVADGPVVWAVHVPAGYGVDAPGHDPARATNRAGLELCRAEAQLRLSRVLAPRAHGQGDAFATQLGAAQRRFYQSWRRAEHWLDTAGARAPLVKSASPWGETDRTAAARAAADAPGPQGQTLAEWLHQLDEDNARIARDSPELEALRAEARRQPRVAPTAAAPGRCAPDLDDRGTPLYWRAADPATAAPALTLVAPEARQTRRSLGATLLLGALLLTAWLLSTFPGVQARLRALWPEQVAVLGGLAWVLLGLSPVAAALVLFGVSGRLAWLGLRLWAWLWREAPAPAGGAASG
jgi:hypothetical protein